MTQCQLFKEEYFPLHQAAMACREAHERQGREVEVIPRLRVGVVIYCVKSYIKIEKEHER